MSKRHTPAFKANLVQEALKEVKTLAQLAAENEVHPNQIGAWKATAIAGMPTLFERESNAQKEIAAFAQEREELYAQIGRLTTQVNWLKKNLVSTCPRQERLGMVEREEDAELSLSEQAELLGVSRSSLYYIPRPPSAREVAIKHWMDELFTHAPCLGARRLAFLLTQEGMPVDRKTVRTYMVEMGLEAIYPKPNLSQPAPDHKIYPYLLRGVTSGYPNHIWGIDITYIRLLSGWMYLVAIIDWYSRYIVRWELDQTLEIGFVLSCLDRALAGATPAISNSDQGSHFTSPQFVQRLLDKGAAVSMDGRGRAMDNIFTERFWRTVKYEEVYPHSYETPRDARQRLTRYLTYYNEERPHQSLGYRTPAEVYFGTNQTDSEERRGI